jgi:hypothetical protein
MTSQTIHDALTSVWQSAGGGVELLLKDMRLWHCGRIKSTDQIDNQSTLWTTRIEANRLHYAAIAQSPCDWTENPAAAIELRTCVELIAADFAGSSLLDFTRDYCDCKHPLMSRALRDWCLSLGFGAIVRLNGGHDEVVFSTPRSSLKVVASTPL